jgi:hypothetical protein
MENGETQEHRHWKSQARKLNHRGQLEDSGLHSQPKPQVCYTNLEFMDLSQENLSESENLGQGW